MTDPYTRTTEVHQTLWYVLYTEFSTSDMNSEYTKGDGTETRSEQIDEQRYINRLVPKMLFRSRRSEIGAKVQGAELE